MKNISKYKYVILFAVIAVVCMGYAVGKRMAINDNLNDKNSASEGQVQAR